MNFPDEQLLERYSRQLILEGWTLDLQKRLAELRLVLPAGLTSAVLYLAAVGCRIFRLDDSGALPAGFSPERLKDHLLKFNQDLILLDPESPGPFDAAVVVDQPPLAVPYPESPLQIRLSQPLLYPEVSRNGQAFEVIPQPPSALPAGLPLGTLLAMLIIEEFQSL